MGTKFVGVNTLAGFVVRLTPGAASSRCMMAVLVQEEDGGPEALEVGVIAPLSAKVAVGE
jgi:hypothetical protein